MGHAPTVTDGRPRLVHRAVVQDVAVAGLLAALSLLAAWRPPPTVGYEFREPDALRVLLSLGAATAVAVRSVHPPVAVLASLTAGVPLVVLGYGEGVGALATLLALYSLAVSRPARTSIPLLLVAVAAVGLALPASPAELTLVSWVANLCLMAGTWLFGRTVRVRRAHRESVDAQRAAEAAARDAASRVRLVEERSEIAREMHDLVAHNLTEINVQAAAARRLLRAGDVDTAERLLVEAESIGRTAMQEMRRAVGVLGAESDAELRPQPGLAALEELVEEQNHDGRFVSLRVTGAPRDVSPGIALTAFRVVEEALGLGPDDAPSRAEVTVIWSDESLEVRVAAVPEHPVINWDGGDPTAPEPVSRLRRRVETYGGELLQSDTHDGGFVLTARIPTTALGRQP